MTSKARENGTPSKYIRRFQAKLKARIAGYEESIKDPRKARAFHKPGTGKAGTSRS